jgi:hypothetical protein
VDVAATMAAVRQATTLECVDWKCPKFSWGAKRSDCTASASFTALAAQDVENRRRVPVEAMCRQAGASPPLVCNGGKPPAEGQFYCPVTLLGSWEFDGNGRLDLQIYATFFSGLSPQHNGTFAEFGALNGVFASNTRFFERFLGWSGLLIEPVCHPLLAKYRPSAVSVLGAICDDVEIELPSANRWCKELGAGKGTQSVQCHNIRRLMEEHLPGRIDFMSIDMEGAEMMALHQLNFTMAANGEPIPAIAVLLVEWRTTDRDSRVQLMAKAGCQSVRIGGDEIFWHPALVTPRPFPPSSPRS